MKKHLLPVLFCILSFSITGFAQLPAVVAKTEKAVFQIETFNEYGVTLSTGTGFFIDKNGTCITAWHVLEDAKFGFIEDHVGNKYRIKKITRSNVNADIVEFILDTKKNNFPYIPLTSILPAKGTEVFTIGNPAGFKNIVSTGIISGYEINEGTKTIETSTPISSGSSGGPLMNMQGYAIGVINSSYSTAQNLNFATSIQERNKMKNDSLIDLMSDVNSKFFMLNTKAKHDPNLILNSIELNDSLLFINFTYTNLSIASGNNAYVYCNTTNKDETYFIREKNSGTKHYIKGSSLSETIEEAGTLKLAQGIHFFLIFDKIKSLKSFDLIENMKGTDWSFYDLKILESQYLNYDMFDQYKENQFYATRMKLRRKEFEEAKDEIDILKDSIKNNELLEQLSSVVDYTLGLSNESIESIKNLIKLNPTHSEYYASLYTLYLNVDSTTNALECINYAIKYNEENLDYTFYRAELNYKLGYWKDCISDYDKYLKIDRNKDASAYLSRGIAKAMINDDSACADLEKAKDLAESDRVWEKINKEYRKYCNKNK
jgi:serine protease Do